MSKIRASYTIQRDGSGRFYRGAIRRIRDLGVIWECHHEHEAIRPFAGSAVRCAEEELAARTATSEGEQGSDESRGY